MTPLHLSGFHPFCFSVIKALLHVVFLGYSVKLNYHPQQVNLVSRLERGSMREPLEV